MYTHAVEDEPHTCVLFPAASTADAFRRAIGEVHLAERRLHETYVRFELQQQPAPVVAQHP